MSGHSKYVSRDDNSINVNPGSRTGSPTAYSSAALRELLNVAFDDEELTIMCFDHFPEVYNNFRVGISKGQKIHQLLDYRLRRKQIHVLVNEVLALTPAQFARYEGRLPPQDCTRKT